jgi:hypothetical protein
MPQFRLKPQVTLEWHGGLARLLDAATGRTMALSLTEARLLSSLGPEMSAADVVHQMEAQATKLDQATVLALFTRLAGAGFLDTVLDTDEAATTRPRAAPALTDVVPCIRNDLDFTPGRKVGLVEVKDTSSNRSFTLYDFEANIARMLDGRRTIADVMAAAERLGIETSPGALRNFFCQLKAFGFLADKPVPIQPPRGRKPWQPEIREMYRHALRHARRNELAEAVEYLEALLEVDPDVQEAAELLEQVRARQQGASSPGLDFNALHGRNQCLDTPTAAAPNPFERFEKGRVKTEVSQPMRTTRRAPSPPPVPPTLAPPEPRETPDAAMHTSGNSLPPLWTVSTVVSSLPIAEVSDSILAFDPRPVFEKHHERAASADTSAEATVPWDCAVGER